MRKIQGGQVSAVAGPAALAGGLDGPSGVAIDPAGGVLIADTLHHRVVRMAAGEATPVAGLGYGDFSGDGGPATNATLSWPAGVTVGPDGSVYVVDTYQGYIRHVRADGVIVTVAGAVDPLGGGPLIQARLATPRALVRAAPFTLFAGGASGTVQAIRTDGDQLETLVGRYPNTNATADLARFRRGNFPDVLGVAYDDAAQRLYLVAGNTIHVVRWTDRDDVLTWTIDELSDPSNVAAYRDGALAFARFFAPAGLLFDDATRILYVADAGNHVIRAIDLTTNQVSTVVGTPAVRGYFGDGLAAGEALLDGPTAITRGPGGELYVADTGNHRVRRVDPGSGVITTVLGDGVAASSGDGAPATSFPVDAPAGLAADARGNLYVSSTNVVRQLVADDLGVVDGSGVVRTIYGAPPRDVFPATATACLAGVAVVDASTVWTVDACAGLLVALTRTAAP